MYAEDPRGWRVSELYCMFFFHCSCLMLSIYGSADDEQTNSPRNSTAIRIFGKVLR